MQWSHRGSVPGHLVTNQEQSLSLFRTPWQGIFFVFSSTATLCSTVEQMSCQNCCHRNLPNAENMPSFGFLSTFGDNVFKRKEGRAQRREASAEWTVRRAGNGKLVRVCVCVCVCVRVLLLFLCCFFLSMGEFCVLGPPSMTS